MSNTRDFDGVAHALNLINKLASEWPTRVGALSHEIAAWKKKYIDDPASEPVKIPNPYPAQNTVVSNVSGIDPDRWLAEVDAKIADHIARQPTRKLLQGPRTFRERVAWLLFGDE